MQRRFSSFIVASALFAAAAIALGQAADKNTAGPTANQLQLRLLAPAEGATITGNEVRVDLSYNRAMFGQGQGTKFGEPNFPHPIFDVFLDNDLKETLKGGEANVATIVDVRPGEHSIVVMAKNISGEVIDRKEVKIRTAAATSTASTMTETWTVAPPPAPEPPSAPEPEPPAPAPAATEVPDTGSSYPRVALMGLALLITGLLLGRKAR